MTDKPKRPDRGRKSERHGTPELAGSLSFSARGSISDISLSGMAVETDGPLLVGQKYRFDLGGSLFPMLGLVKWCQLKRTEKQSDGEVVSIFRAGLSFEGLLSDEQASLQHFISDIVELEVERRIFGRFELNGDHEIRLTSGSDFQVEKLSNTGMLVKSNFAIATNAEGHFEVDLEGSRFEVDGRVRSVLEHVDSASGRLTYRLGVQFLPSDEQDMQPVASYIEEHYGRFGGSPTDN